jgi:hypothetical protein
MFAVVDDAAPRIGVSSLARRRRVAVTGDLDDLAAPSGRTFGTYRAAAPPVGKRGSCSEQFVICQKVVWTMSTFLASDWVVLVPD